MSIPGRGLTNGIYATMDFPPYVYREYPKTVRRKNGSEAIAQSKSEEMRIIAEDNTDMLEVMLTPDGVRDALDKRDVAIEEQQREIAALRAELAQMAQATTHKDKPKA